MKRKPYEWVEEPDIDAKAHRKKINAYCYHNRERILENYKKVQTYDLQNILINQLDAACRDYCEL